MMHFTIRVPVRAEHGKKVSTHDPDLEELRKAWGSPAQKKSSDPDLDELKQAWQNPFGRRSSPPSGRFVHCGRCGEPFGRASLGIHERQCRGPRPGRPTELEGEDFDPEDMEFTGRPKWDQDTTYDPTAPSPPKGKRAPAGRAFSTDFAAEFVSKFFGGFPGKPKPSMPRTTKPNDIGAGPEYADEYEAFDAFDAFGGLADSDDDILFGTRASPSPSPEDLRRRRAQREAASPAAARANSARASRSYAPFEDSPPFDEAFWQQRATEAAARAKARRDGAAKPGSKAAPGASKPSPTRPAGTPPRPGSAGPSPEKPSPPRPPPPAPAPAPPIKKLSFTQHQELWTRFEERSTTGVRFSDVPWPEPTALSGMFGVDRGAPVDERKRAYKAIMHFWHPDRWARLPLVDAEREKIMAKVVETCQLVNESKKSYTAK